MKRIMVLAVAVLLVFSFSLDVSANSEFSCLDVTEIPQIECEALVALYNSTIGSNWTDSTNWLVTNTPSNWYGVTVTSNHVTGLVLESNNLTGEPWVPLGNQPDTKKLDQNFSQMSESLPQGTGDFSSLANLDPSNSLIPGTSLPPELGNLVDLQNLDLSDNILIGSIPAQLGALVDLQYLDLSNNKLSGSIPAELGDLKSLDKLDINSNPDLTGSLPSNLTNLTLNSFWFGSTGLCEPDDPAFQAWINTIPDLYQTGVLCSSGFTCSLVTEIPQLECEALLALYNSTDGMWQWGTKTNWLVTDTPSNWYGVTVDSGHVVSISLHDNGMMGSIPPELGDLIGLTYLDLSSNAMYSGTIPLELGNLVNLQYLDLSGDILGGSIPSELGRLVSLQHLDLSGDALSGNIPVELGALVNLQYLDLQWNQLSGMVPSELGI